MIERCIKVDEKMILFEWALADKKAEKTVPFELANAEKTRIFAVGKDEVPGSNPGISSRKTSQRRLVFCYICTWFEVSEGFLPRFREPLAFPGAILSVFLSVFPCFLCPQSLDFPGFAAFFTCQESVSS